MKKSYKQPVASAIYMEAADIITSSTSGSGFTYVTEHSGDLVQWKSRD